MGDVVAVLQPQAHAKGLALTIEIAPELDTREFAQDALKQILTNVIDNAIKFSDHAGGAIEVQAQRQADSMRLTIRDRGPGIPAELRDTIFDAFVRAEHAQRDAIIGTGIGLAVVEGLTRQLGGSVIADNRPGGGLEVLITIPLGH